MASAAVMNSINRLVDGRSRSGERASRLRPKKPSPSLERKVSRWLGIRAFPEKV